MPEQIQVTQTLTAKTVVAGKYIFYETKTVQETPSPEKDIQNDDRNRGEIRTRS